MLHLLSLRVGLPEPLLTLLNLLALLQRDDYFGLGLDLVDALDRCLGGVGAAVGAALGAIAGGRAHLIEILVALGRLVSIAEGQDWLVYHF